MAHGATSDEERLLELAASGDAQAREQLLSLHVRRLRRMVEIRLDDRLAARLDPSDVVQETLVVAHQRLPEYLATRPLPFYPWLRAIACDRLVDQHRRHLGARRRSVDYESPPTLGLSARSEAGLARQLLADQTTPSQSMMRREMVMRVRSALSQLDPADCEILVMRHLERLSVADIAALLGISEGAVKMRRLRAVERLRNLLDETSEAK